MNAQVSVGSIMPLCQSTATATSCYDQRKASTEQLMLPRDPRIWSKEDVVTWLVYTCTCNFLPSIPLRQFQMNGKALCLMSVEMFCKRLPVGGKLLYRDFRLRLAAAVPS